MTTTESATPTLDTALAAAQGEMPNAVFNRINPHFKSRYADLAAIREATTKTRSKHGLAILHQTKVLENGTMMVVGILTHGASKQQRESEWLIESSTPQGRGSDLTYGRRYTWCCLTGVVADDDDDANAAEDAAKDTATPQLSKARSRTRYEALTKEMGAITNKNALTAWGLENTDRIYSMNDEYQRYFRGNYKDRLTAIAEGVTEDGSEVVQDSEFKQKLRESLDKEIDDEIVAEGGGDEA